MVRQSGSTKTPPGVFIVFNRGWVTPIKPLSLCNIRLYTTQCTSTTKVAECMLSFNRNSTMKLSFLHFVSQRGNTIKPH